MKKKEHILCAANYYLEENKYVNQPFNIDSGFVIAGMRRINCVTSFKMINPSVNDKKIDVIEGFITSKNNFVTRERAAEIAFDGGQIKTLVIALYSQDLY
jgi:hypothetical protein